MSEGDCRQKNYRWTGSQCINFEDFTYNTWFDSQADCAAKGASLLTLTSRDSYDQLTSTVECWHTSFWVGASRIKWHWTTSNQYL